MLRKGVWKLVCIDKGKLETARNMLERGFALEDICDVTGLCEEDILNG